MNWKSRYMRKRYKKYVRRDKRMVILSVAQGNPGVRFRKKAFLNPVLLLDGLLLIRLVALVLYMVTCNTFTTGKYP